MSDPEQKFTKEESDAIGRMLEWKALQLEGNLENPAGFKLFYELLYGRLLPKHAYEEWIIPLFEAIRDPALEGWLGEAFRGSSKSTTVTVAFDGFLIGLHPDGSGLIIMDSDENAAAKGKELARIIADNPAWRDLFPHVRPDEKSGWSESGYNVRDTRMERGDFLRQKSINTPDPTFIAKGYKSGSLIGKHPTLFLTMDDLHNEDNTRSDKELKQVIDYVQGTILPLTETPTGGTKYVLIVGTPWRKNDIIAFLKSTGLFKTAFTPVIRDGKPTWPEGYGHDKIEKAKKKSATKYAQNYLLDLTAAEGIFLKREWLYPRLDHTRIKDDWPVVLAVDYASGADEFVKKGRDPDYCAIAEGRLMPNGGVVVVGGVMERFSRGEAEKKLLSYEGLYGDQIQAVGIETDGIGREFFSVMLRNSKLPLVACGTKGKGKRSRFEAKMAPLFQFNRAKISDEENSFLNALIDQWLEFPLGQHDDALDAVYWLLHVSQYNMYGDDSDYDMELTNPQFTAKITRPNRAKVFERR